MPQRIVGPHGALDGRQFGFSAFLAEKYPVHDQRVNAGHAAYFRNTPVRRCVQQPFEKKVAATKEEQEQNPVKKFHL